MIIKLIGVATLFTAGSILVAGAPTLGATSVDTQASATRQLHCAARRCGGGGGGGRRCGGGTPRCASVPRCGGGIPRCSGGIPRCASRPRCGTAMPS